MDSARLNRVLVRLYRGLLEYVGECWPWMAWEQASAEQKAVEELLALRRAEMTRLVDLLLERGWSIEFGSYPTEYTDLHYVALDYLLDELIRDSVAISSELAGAVAASDGDSEARTLLQDLAVVERQIEHKLRELKAQPKVS